MEKQRFLLAIAVLLVLQMAAAPSSARYSAPAPSDLAKILKSGQFGELLRDFVRSYQRQSDTITLEATQLGEAHRVAIATTAALEGTLQINGEVVRTLGPGSTEIDVAPYLQPGQTQILITGRYAPDTAAVVMRFDGPEIHLRQQPAESGVLNYQLTLQVD